MNFSDDRNRSNDDYLEISWDDLADDGETPLGTASSPPPSANSRPDVLPMTKSGTCSQCGFALGPLDQECSRCRNPELAHKYAETTTPRPAAPAGEGVVSRPNRLRPFLFASLGAFLLVAAAIVVYVHVQSPRARAMREFRQGLAAQLDRRFAEAQQHYTNALELNPSMALAAFFMGLSHLHISGADAADALMGLQSRAVYGDTRAFDLADEWFRRSINIAENLPPETRLTHDDINTPARLQSFAYTFMALTALARATAALEADQWDDAFAWLRVAGSQAALAIRHDPSNSLARELQIDVNGLR